MKVKLIAVRKTQEIGFLPPCEISNSWDNPETQFLSKRENLNNYSLYQTFDDGRNQVSY
ncbi:hypothetical protein [Brunnivagina elsteri]|uniref:hypothetical protein n=1 Tax=Brunnivagina elsteri TaxID=1247191 RepID=UPI001304183B|nr:hypothetical protein [Calothrix elsteri]